MEKRSPIKIRERTHTRRRRLVEQVPISELGDKQGLQPTVLYRWQKELF